MTDEATGGTVLSRRRALRAASVLGLGIAGGSVTAACGDSGGSDSTALRFLARDQFFVAHRGAWVEAPEHTLAAYSRIVDRGAEAISIAVHRTRDGVLVCHEEPTVSGTVGRNVAIADVTLDELSNYPVDLTRWVGPGWGTQPIPTFSEVLERLGKRAVLFVESKNPQATADVIGAITSNKLSGTVVFTQSFTDREGESAARAAGLAVWTYLDDAAATTSEIVEAAHGSDAIGLLATSDPLTQRQQTRIQVAVETGKPVIMWPVNRRSQLAELSKAGVRGFLSPSWSYLALPADPSPHDTFATGRIAPGDLAGDTSPFAAPEWGPDASMVLADRTSPQALSMGSMCPVPAAPYVITLEVQFVEEPPLFADHLAIVIGRNDDSEYRLGKVAPDTGHGQLVVLRSNGSLELRDIPDDNDLATLQSETTGEVPTIGEWQTLQISVKPGSVTVEQNPGQTDETISVTAPRTGTGDYFTLARNYSGETARVAFRNIRVTYN